MPPPKKTTERSESQVSKGEGRRLATKGTKSTKGRTTDLDLPFVLFVPFVANLLPIYSCRSAIVGSIRDAFRAGAYPARTVAVTNVITAAAKANGSFRFIPKRKDSRYFESPISASGWR